MLPAESRALVDTDVRAHTKERGSAATSRGKGGGDVKSIIEAYVMVSARKDIRGCECGNDVIICHEGRYSSDGKGVLKEGGNRH